MIILLEKPATEDDIKKASEELGDYIKIIVDIVRYKVAIGGELHADAEKLMIEQGSKQKDIWGGGIDLATKKLFTNAMINIRPNQGNDSMEILDQDARQVFLEVARQHLLVVLN